MNYTRIAAQVQALQDEGVDFVDGRASAANRVSADDFRRYLSEAGEPIAPSSRRAWLVRGYNVNGVDLVTTWLAKGSCSLAASQLRPIEPPLSRREIAGLVEDDYAHVSYNARNEKTAEFDAFLNRMHVEDLVVTTSQGDVFIGTVTGDATYVTSIDDRSNLRRTVRWSNADHPIDFADLPAALKARLSSQHAVVDLTSDIAVVERLLLEESPADAVLDVLTGDVGQSAEGWLVPAG